MLAAGGFFFLPLLIVVPNAQAVKNVAFQLLELQGDYRYAMLFLLCLIPFFIAFQSEPLRRGWLLVGVGNLIIILTMWLSAIAAQDLLANATTILPADAFIRNPRVRPVGAVATGLLGGYMVMFGGLSDLRAAGVPQITRFIAGVIGLLAVYWLFVDGRLDAFSIVLEYRVNGDNLTINLLKHLSYVLVALVTGLALGIGLGFWASRQERAAPVILYVVGIIQTIPSLALFGLLLVPLSNLGRQRIWGDILVYVVPLTVVISGFLFIVNRYGDRLLPRRIQYVLVVAVGAGLLVPFLVLILMFISLFFQISFRVIGNSEYREIRTFVEVVVVALIVVTIFGRQWKVFRRDPQLFGRVRSGLIVLTALGVIIGIVQGGIHYLPTDTAFSDWVLSDIGIKGLGESPSLVALLLYSLLPLVRNTYAGLNNVDQAIIDSGRGMGMTPSQIFFRIELPLAFPVIMAGVRNAAIALVGIATIAAVVGGGALGEYVIEGANRISIDLILLGTIPAILLAFVLDAGLRLFETVLTSPGIRQ